MSSPRGRAKSAKYVKSPPKIKTKKKISSSRPSSRNNNDLPSLTLKNITQAQPIETEVEPLPDLDPKQYLTLDYGVKKDPESSSQESDDFEPEKPTDAVEILSNSEEESKEEQRVQTAELEAIELVKKKTLEKRRIKKSPRLLVKE